VFPVICKLFEGEEEDEDGERNKEKRIVPFCFSAIAFIGKGCPHFGPEGLIDLWFSLQKFGFLVFL
jgi:hypothetical protein